MEELYNKYGYIIDRVLARFGLRDDEDAVQDVTLRFLEACNTYPTTQQNGASYFWTTLTHYCERRHQDAEYEEVPLYYARNVGGTTHEHEEYKVFMACCHDDLAQVFTELSQREEKVLRMLYGIDCAEYTHPQIARKLGIPATRVWEIGATALRKLRYPGRAERLAGYI